MKVNQNPRQYQRSQQEKPLICSSKQESFCRYGWSKIDWYAGSSDLSIVRSVTPKIQKARNNRNDYSRVFENFNGSICTVHAPTSGSYISPCRRLDKKN